MLSGVIVSLSDVSCHESNVSCRLAKQPGLSCRPRRIQNAQSEFRSGIDSVAPILATLSLFSQSLCLSLLKYACTRH